VHVAYVTTVVQYYKNFLYWNFIGTGMRRRQILIITRIISFNEYLFSGIFLNTYRTERHTGRLPYRHVYLHGHTSDGGVFEYVNKRSASSTTHNASSYSRNREVAQRRLAQFQSVHVPRVFPIVTRFNLHTEICY
jgi:hypothetical protein